MELTGRHAECDVLDRLVAVRIRQCLAQLASARPGRAPPGSWLPGRAAK